jgi:dTDP-4-dehydrorhamnose reductase
VRVLVLGAGGMLGQELVPELAARGHEPCGKSRAELDIRSREALAAAMAAVRPRAVINCAAFTDVDGAEAREAEAMAVNGAGAGLAAAAAVAHGARLLHVSTDYVFAGDGSRPLVETDPVAPISAYGRSKLAGERAVAAAAPGALIVRGAWLYGRGGRNFVDAIRGRAERGQPLEVVSDQVGSPTWARSLAAALVHLLEVEARGVLHFAAAGAASRYDQARAIVAELDLKVEVKPITTAAAAPRPARRPAYSALDSSRYEIQAGHKAPAWRDDLRRYLGQD